MQQQDSLFAVLAVLLVMALLAWGWLVALRRATARGEKRWVVSIATLAVPAYIYLLRDLFRKRRDNG